MTAIDLDFDKGMPLRVMPVRDKKSIFRMSVRRMLRLVGDPRQAENPKAVAHGNSADKEYARLRNEVQRAVEGGKAKNAVKFAAYIARGIKGELGEGWSLPSITLWSPEQLSVTQTPGAGFGPEHIMMVPYDAVFIAIDGETQTIAYMILFQDPAAYGLTADQVGDFEVSIEHYNGISLNAARQVFHDRNTLEVKPNSAISISMDERDPATRLAMRLMNELDVDEPRTNQVVKLGDLVSTRKRQLAKADREWLTLSQLRQLVVTAMLGSTGLQVGSRPVDESKLPHEDSADRDVFDTEVLAVLSTLFKRFAEEFADREGYVIGTPAVIAAIGVIANQTLTVGGSQPHIGRARFVEILTEVDFTRKVDVWDGIAGKRTAKGGLAMGGSKEAGYAVLKALQNEGSAEGLRIRGHRITTA